jgi:hypothetical protein
VLNRGLREPAAIIFAAALTLFLSGMASLVVVVIAQQAATLKYREAQATVIRAASTLERQSAPLYRFSVNNGDEFEGQRARAGMFSVDITARRDSALAADLAPGDPLIVYYDTRDPTRSVVHRGIDGWLFVLLGAQIPFWIVITALWLGIRWSRRAHR